MRTRALPLKGLSELKDIEGDIVTRSCDKQVKKRHSRTHSHKVTI